MTDEYFADLAQTLRKRWLQPNPNSSDPYDAPPAYLTNVSAATPQDILLAALNIMTSLVQTTGVSRPPPISTLAITLMSLQTSTSAFIIKHSNWILMHERSDPQATAAAGPAIYAALIIRNLAQAVHAAVAPSALSKQEELGPSMFERMDGDQATPSSAVASTVSRSFERQAGRSRDAFINLEEELLALVMSSKALAPLLTEPLALLAKLRQMSRSADA